MSAVNAALLLGAGDDGYQISRSVRLRNSASGYFNRTFAAAGNRQKMTFSMWVKRGQLAYRGLHTAGWSGSGASQGGAYINFSGDSVEVSQQTNNAYDWRVVTTPVYRDPSAWYHIVVAIDTTQATTANRVIVYVNGVQVTSYSTASYPTLNLSTKFNATNQRLFALDDAGNPYVPFDGYATETFFIDGQALTPSSFGETDAVTGVWKPKKYAGTYGTNGFYLNFSDNSNNTAATIGKDYSGNGNNWTPNNISVTAGVTYDSMIDVPTMWADGGNGRGNYAVLNPLNIQGNTSSASVTEANLKGIPSPSASGFANFLASIAAPSTGYWYAEFTVSGTYQGANNNAIGLQPVASKSTYALGYDSFSYGYWDGDRTTGSFKNNNTTSQSPAGFQTGDTLMIAFGNGNVWFGKNGAWLGTGSPNPATATSPAYSGLSGDFYIGYSAYGTSGVTYGYNSFANFGQRPFAYTPPTGFKALNTQNLPDATIKKGNAYFDSSLYTGNGTSVSVTNSGAFQPDFVWLKQRSGANQHNLMDAVRGAAYRLRTDATNAEEATPGTFTFDASGFTANTTNVSYNTSGGTYVAWQWKESVTAGFDIVTYTGNGTSGRTVAHSLGVAPAMTIIKNRSTGYWIAWHKSLASYASNLYLNTTDSVQADGNFTVLPSSTVLTLDANKSVNVNANNYVAYLFAEVAGFSKFGSYTGNGSTDGPFVFCGFRPAFIMIKRTDTTGNWTIHDNRRSGYNGSSASKELYPNLSNAEGSDSMDQLSNGFKLRDTYADVNASGGTYIYACFAENPFKNSLAR